MVSKRQTVSRPAVTSRGTTSPETSQHHPASIQSLPPGVAFAGRLIPVTAWNEFHPWPPVGGLRHLVFHAKQNGFEQVVRRAGRRVLIDEAAFFRWVSQQGVSA